MIALFSDLHAHGAALEKVLPEMSRSEAILCLGDTVGYRKDPGTTLALVRDNADLVLMGNHDAAATGQFDAFLELIPPWLGDTLEEVASVDPMLFEWLATRPRRALWGQLELVHGSFRDPLMEFLVPGQVAMKHLAQQQEKISCVGHTHKPLAIGMIDEEQKVFLPSKKNPTLDLSKLDKWVLNPGSLGVKGKGQGPSWMSLDLDSGMARWHFLH